MSLAGRDVHLWSIRLGASAQRYDECCSWLADDERARAARFHFEKHRRAYVLGRGALRALLASYLGARPAEITFRYGAKGKPALGGAASGLRFNVSNSADFAVCAFTRGLDVGVDVEHRLRPLPDLAGVAERFFAAEEFAELMALPEDVRPAAFYNCWTRKEAYIKAIGDGLSVPLDSFRVTLVPGAAARMVHLNGSEEAARRWTMHAFEPAPDYVAALAYEDSPRPLKIHPAVTVDDLIDELAIPSRTS